MIGISYAARLQACFHTAPPAWVDRRGVFTAEEVRQLVVRRLRRRR